MTENQSMLLLLLYAIDEKKNSTYAFANLLNIKHSDFLQEVSGLSQTKHLVLCEKLGIDLLEKGRKYYSKTNIQKIYKGKRFHFFANLFLSYGSEYNHTLRNGIEKIRELLNEGKALTAATLLKVILFTAQKQSHTHDDLLTIKDYIDNIIFLIVSSIYLRIHIRTSKQIILSALKLAQQIQDKRSEVLLECWLAISEFYQDDISYADVERKILKTIKMFSELNDSELAFHLGFAISVLYFVRGRYDKIALLNKTMQHIKIHKNLDFTRLLIDVFLSASSNALGDIPTSLGKIKYAIQKAKLDKNCYAEFYFINHYCTMLSYMERFEEAYYLAKDLYQHVSIHEQPQFFFSSLALQAFCLHQLGKKAEAFSLMDTLFSHFNEDDDFSIMPTNSIFLLDILFFYSNHKPSPFVRTRTISMTRHFLRSPNPYYVGQAKRILALNLLRRGKDSQRALRKINESIEAFKKGNLPFERIKAERIKAQIYEQKQYKYAHEFKKENNKQYINYKDSTYYEQPTHYSDMDCINKTHKLLSDMPRCATIQDLASHIAFILGNVLKAERVLIIENTENAYKELAGYNFELRDSHNINTIKQTLLTKLQGQVENFYSQKDNYMLLSLKLIQEEQSRYDDFFQNSQEIQTQNKNIQNEFNSVFQYINNSYQSKKNMPKQWLVYACGEYILQQFSNTHCLEIIEKLLITHICSQYDMLLEKNLVQEKMPTIDTQNLEESKAIFVTNSPKFQECISQINMVAQSSSTVILLGETGVGKEVIARYIHNMSKRKGNFIAINPASISGSLFESEFFGHEKGSFTGATSQKKGFFELANEGTLFIDEVGDIPLSMQVKLLRVLEEKTFMRVGSMKEIRSTFRLITATNVDLLKIMDEGSFRTDFFYRLSTFPITIPPLRERLEDLEILIPYMVQNLAKMLRKEVPLPSKSEIEKLKQYEWKGNIRELKNTIERAIIYYTQGDFHLATFIPQEKQDTENQNLNSYTPSAQNALSMNYEDTQEKDTLHNFYDPASCCLQKNVEESKKDTFNIEDNVSMLADKILSTKRPTMKTLQEGYFRLVLEQTKGKLFGENSVQSILDMKKSTIYAKIKEYGITKKYQ